MIVTLNAKKNENIGERGGGGGGEEEENGAVVRLDLTRRKKMTDKQKSMYVQGQKVVDASADKTKRCGCGYEE